MQVKLHANATTSSEQQEYIEELDKPVKHLAKELGGRHDRSVLEEASSSPPPIDPTPARGPSR